MAWVASQRFAKQSRHFVANTNLNSRAWSLWRWHDDDDDDTDDDGETDSNELGGYDISGTSKKVLAYTPSFGRHVFWYKGRLLRFNRIRSQQQGYVVASETEEICLSCFGRSPAVLKELLLEARAEYLKKDTKKTMIYRGNTRSGTSEPYWQRCMARTSRPFSTVILNEKKKKELVEDVSDYLSPATRNWYSNRGIPWRRGYLFTGPPGTGKSSLSLALAGHFKLRIYIVNLNSISASEDSLASLFAELPQRCVVLLEDIDAAGLTHTRETNTTSTTTDGDGKQDGMVPGQITNGNGNGNGNNSNNTISRLSLSGLLNILDGVASQEGRVLIMTTNHVEKLDKALIRPGRVDMTVNFTLADLEIAGSIFRAIYAPLEGEQRHHDKLKHELLSPDQKEAVEAKAAEKQAETVAHIEALSHDFAAKIPEHEFSPAEIQGFLMRHKRDPEAAIRLADGWVAETRKQKKEKEIKEAEKKREEEKKRKEEEEKKRKEEEEEKKDEKKEDSDGEAPQATEPTAPPQLSSDDKKREGQPQKASGSTVQLEKLDTVHPGKDGAESDRDSGYESPVKSVTS